MNKEKLAVLIDGSGFIYRAYYALPQFFRSDKTPTGAVYGFCSMLMATIDEHPSDIFAVILDSSRKTFRNNIYSEYKSNRKTTPEDLIPQFPILREACNAFGIKYIEKDGFEADDLIATYAKKFEADGYSVRIISSDKDLTQLITEKISMFDPIKSKHITSDSVLEKYGVFPNQMRYLQALMGDASDNVPGVQGIGPKTASKLIAEYGDLDNLYNNINKITQNKLRENLIACKELADISLQLVTLATDVELDSNAQELRVTTNNNVLMEFFKKMEFHSLITRLNNKMKIMNNRNRVHIENIAELENFLATTPLQKISFFCIEKHNKVTDIAICIEKNVTCFAITESSGDLFQSPRLSFKDAVSVLNKYFYDQNIIKYTIRSCHEYFSIRNFHNLSLFAYLLNGVNNTVGAIFDDAGNIKNLSLDSHQFDHDQMIKIVQLIYDNADLLYQQLIDNGLESIYTNIDLPLSEVLVKMQNYGVRISKSALNALSLELNSKIKILEESIFTESGCVFNINSVKQLSNVLFNIKELKLSNGKQSTDIEALSELAQNGSELANLIIQWRKLFKLLSTYTEPLCKSINHITNRIHTTYSMTSTITGRLSSFNPNLQNIPVRSDYGKRIHATLIAADGYQLIAFDYSQIELRILAHMAKIEILQNAFTQNQDVHTITAMQVFNVPFNLVTEDMRRQAKTINFGIIYGMSPFRLSQVLNISHEQATSYINKYLEKFSGFECFKKNILQFARKHGYVQTMIGRKCYTKDINAKNFQLRSFSERQAINATIQGTAADIIKIAMINIDKSIEPDKAKMLLQIHDELVFEIKTEEIDNISLQIKTLMENAVTLDVPLIVS